MGHSVKFGDVYHYRFLNRTPQLHSPAGQARGAIPGDPGRRLSLGIGRLQGYERFLSLMVVGPITQLMQIHRLMGTWQVDRLLSVWSAWNPV